MANSTSLVDVLGFCEENEVIYRITPVLFPFILLGITGNVLVLIIIWKNKEMRNPTNLLLTNISASDLLYLLVQAPATIAYGFKTAIYIYEINGFYLFQLSMAVQDASFINSMLTVTLLASERYRALFYALEPQRHLEKRGVKRAIGLMWCLSIFFGFTLISNVNVSKDVRYISVIIWAMLFSILPSVLTIYFYAKIVIGICITKTICGQGERTAEENESIKRTVKMLLLVTVIVVVSKIPFPIMYTAFWQTKTNLSCTLQIVWTSTCLASCSTPMVYFTLCANYKDGLKRLCKRCLCINVRNAVGSE